MPSIFVTGSNDLFQRPDQGVAPNFAANPDDVNDEVALSRAQRSLPRGVIDPNSVSDPFERLGNLVFGLTNRDKIDNYNQLVDRVTRRAVQAKLEHRNRQRYKDDLSIANAQGDMAWEGQMRQEHGVDRVKKENARKADIQAIQDTLRAKSGLAEGVNDPMIDDAEMNSTFGNIDPSKAAGIWGAVGSVSPVGGLIPSLLGGLGAKAVNAQHGAVSKAAVEQAKQAQRELEQAVQADADATAEAIAKGADSMDPSTASHLADQSRARQAMMVRNASQQVGRQLSIRERQRSTQAQNARFMFGQQATQSRFEQGQQATQNRFDTHRNDALAGATLAGQREELRQGSIAERQGNSAMLSGFDREISRLDSKIAEVDKELLLKNKLSKEVLSDYRANQALRQELLSNRNVLAARMSARTVGTPDGGVAVMVAGKSRLFTKNEIDEIKNRPEFQGMPKEAIIDEIIRQVIDRP